MVSFADFPSSSVEFTFKLDGDAVSNSTMDVRDFAPAIRALGQAFERANFLLNSDSASVNLRIVATRRGSFEILLVLSQFFEAQASVADNIKTALDLKDLLIGSPGAGVAIIVLIKRLRGRKPDRVEPQPHNRFDIHIDHFTVNVPRETLQLSNDRIIRGRLKEVVQPLAQRGISRIVFGEYGDEIDSVGEDEAVFFKDDLDDNTVNEFVIDRQALTLVSPVFGGGGKWRLHDGLKNNWYTMSDEKFLHAIWMGNIRLGEDDLLICSIKSTQRRDERRLRSELEIISVLELQSANGQVQALGTSEDRQNLRRFRL